MFFGRMRGLVEETGMPNKALSRETRWIIYKPLTRPYFWGITLEVDQPLLELRGSQYICFARMGPEHLSRLA